MTRTKLSEKPKGKTQATFCILNYSRVFRQKKIIKCVLVSGKQMSSTPLSHSNLIFTICRIKAQTHSSTGDIHAPTGDFGQDLKKKKKKKLKAHC